MMYKQAAPLVGCRCVITENYPALARLPIGQLNLQNRYRLSCRAEIQEKGWIR